jgi:hypothetical protein
LDEDDCLPIILGSRQASRVSVSPAGPQRAKRVKDPAFGGVDTRGAQPLLQLEQHGRAALPNRPHTVSPNHGRTVRPLTLASRGFLQENWNYLKPTPTYMSMQFLKLCCYYDMLAYRWPDASRGRTSKARLVQKNG